MTHYHSDHIGDLPEVATGSWMQNAPKRDGPLPIYGGPGIEQIAAGVNTMNAMDVTYRNVHHTSEHMPVETAGLTPVLVDVPGDESEGLAFWERELEVPLLPAPSINWAEGATGPSEDVVKVTAFHVEHDPCKPSYGYKFEYRGRTAVVSGDTGYCPSIVKQSQDVDILVHEACACHLIDRARDLLQAQDTPETDRLDHMMMDLSQPNVHTSPDIVMSIAAEANVRHLAYTHIVPPMRNPLLRRMWSSVIKPDPGWKGTYTIGEDGDHFAFPGGVPDSMVRMSCETGQLEKSALGKNAPKALSALAVLAICYWLAPGGAAKSVANRKFALGLLVAAVVGRRASL